MSFKINDYIILKLENNNTIIYISNEKFLLCKFLLINIPTDKTSLFDDITSIDEVSEMLNRSMVFNKDKGIKISPETEFWGHCSNIQVWCENNYNTRILHRNLAFPMLKKLTEKGDPKAKKVFKDEIAERFASGNISVMNYLTEEGYLNYLNEEEFQSLSKEIKEKNIEFIIYPHRKFEFIYNGILDLKNKKLDDLNKIIGLDGEKKIIELDLINNYLKTFPETICELNSLQKLYLDNNNLIKIPDSISKIKSLKEFTLTNNDLNSLPESIGNLKSLEILDLSTNKITMLPKTLGNMKSLRDLYLTDNRLVLLPDSIGDLKSLQKLYLRNNNLSTLPETIGKLNSLKVLDLSGNNLEILPEVIGNLKMLRELYLEDNRLSLLPGSICKLKSLQKLLLNWNKLIRLPEAIGKLISLRILNLYDNNLNVFPESIKNLNSLEELYLNGNNFSDNPEFIDGFTVLFQELVNKGVKIFI